MAALRRQALVAVARRAGSMPTSRRPRSSVTIAAWTTSHSAWPHGVTMAEIDRIKGLLTDQVAADVSEEITAIGYFFREDTANDSFKHGPRFLRRVLAKRDDHLEDHLGSMNVIVLTPTPLHIYAGKTKAPWLQVTKKLGAWLLHDVR